jgi:AhpD family alkylhydroperoxidase
MKMMDSRLNIAETAPGALKALYGINGYLAKSSLGRHLLELVSFRVSQINGCAFCLDMHSKDLLAAGETGQRLYVLDAWREAPFYSERERAALLWAETVTRIPGNEIPDRVYEEVKKQFNEQELVDLTLAVAGINTWNRLNLAFRPVVGTYQVGQFN